MVPATVGISGKSIRLHSSGEQNHQSDNQSTREPTAVVLVNIRLRFLFQVTVWGDYGRIEGKKVFMGAAQIMLDDLDLSNIVIGWYKLFGTTSLVSGPPSLGLSRRSSLASLDSFKL